MAQVERELTRVSIDYLALRQRDFDGSFREPRESEVLDAFAARAEGYRRPEEASLSLVVFNRPAAHDSAGATDAAYRAWEQRLRARADSAMKALRRGARFEDLAGLNGGMKKVTLRRDQMPDVWRGTSRDVAAAFAAAPGAVLSDPVRVAPGWALVRVDAVLPSRAPLAEVAREVRDALRAGTRARQDDLALAGPGFFLGGRAGRSTRR